MLPTKPLSIYIHVPFCKAKCTYCDFYSLVGRETSIPAFVKRICEELARAKSAYHLKDYYLDTIFFGGGTPNLLSPQQLDTILRSIHDLVAGSHETEIGLEVNPGEISQNDLHNYIALGFNRISVGVQSFQPDLLRFMSRIHTVEQSIDTFRLIRQAGFKNVSGDLIFAIPGQTRDVWLADLQRLVELEPEHISTYSLTVEEGTALHRWVTAGHVHMLEEVMDIDMYSSGRDFLADQGYVNYEISNHALPGHHCRHNMNYWTGVEYLGFGPGAHSYFASNRFWNPADLHLYLNPETEGSFSPEMETIDQQTAANEMILTRLRLTEGLNISEFNNRFHEDFLAGRQAILHKWSEELSLTGNRLQVTRAGWSLIDEISSDLMHAV